jgi:hypothetical protein
MKHAACLLAILALVVLLVLVFDLSGATATLFMFVGCPVLALALFLYFIARWREGAFRFEHANRLSQQRR